MLQEFKTFIARGNVLDLAVAVIIGAAFGKIVTSLTEDVLMISRNLRGTLASRAIRLSGRGTARSVRARRSIARSA